MVQVIQQAWKIGLKATGTVSAGDTQATHGFTEITAYSTAGGATSLLLVLQQY